MSDMSTGTSGASASTGGVSVDDFPIVGIGCSAGGLEALEKFFTGVRSASGLAFVVVQHLSPTHHSALPELLARFTPLPVVEARDGMVVQAGGVYVNPPGKDLTLSHGVLHLSEPTAARGLRLPIDVFLHTLAADRCDRAIGVLLSGMGSDGVLGLRAIKQGGGLTLVQDPASAQADGMPGSAIQAGVVDIVVEPQAMVGRILAHLGHPPAPVPAEAPPLDNSDALHEINRLLRGHCGNDFSLYKSNTMMRRIERRIAVRQASSLGAYAALLQHEPQEVALLFQELLIGVTAFFRDPAMWDELRDVALPALLDQHPAGRVFRAWVPACSTGEEAYSLAIVFAEAVRAHAPRTPFSLQIFATDLDPAAVDLARKGLYPAGIANDVSGDRLERYFVPADGGRYRVRKEIRETLVFAIQNIAADPPFTRLDVLSCRNLLIYFDATLQKRLVPLFHFALVPGGLLVLGSAETTGSFSHLFVPVNLSSRIYRRDQQARRATDLHFAMQRQVPLSIPGTPPAPDPTDTLGPLTDQLIQQTWAPAAVLVNPDGDILYISGRTGKYLEPAVGKVNINIHAMARAGLREALAGVIHRAVSGGLPVMLRGLHVGTNGGTQVVNVTVQALDRPEPLRGKVILVFEDVAPARRRRQGGVPSNESTSALQEELQQTREALQATHEAMQTTVEELRSSNEELQSTNEELQSTNEELTTSKEELQSVNEELQTVNAELQSKVDDLTWVKNDMSNLLNSTEIATVFLDGQLNVRRYTNHAVKLFRLIPGDIGRPLAHIVTDLDYPLLTADAAEVLGTLIFKESVVATDDGRWYRVRVMPYRTQDNLIAGVVITFIDVTAVKKLEAELRAAGS